MFRTFEPVPQTVTAEDTAAALVAADRMGQFRSGDLREVLRSAGMARSDRWVRKAIAQMARDGLVRRTARDRFAWWAITAQGEAWAAKVWTGPALSGWGYRPRQPSRHRALLNELFAAVAETLDGAPVLGLWRSHGRATVGTYDVSYDPDARVDLDGLSVWVEVDRGTVRPSQLKSKLGRLREVLAFRDFGRNRCIRVLWVLERPSPTRFAQLAELFADWLDEWLCTAPTGLTGERAGAGPALAIWVGSAEACLERLRAEWHFWAGRPEAARPHEEAAQRITQTLQQAGYAGATVHWVEPPGAWRMPLVRPGPGRPGLLVLDARYEAGVLAWAGRAEAWAATLPGGRIYPVFWLAGEEAADLLAGRRVLWTTSALFATDGGLRLAPRKAGAAASVAGWERIAGPVRPGPGPGTRPARTARRAR